MRLNKLSLYVLLTMVLLLTGCNRKPSNIYSTVLPSQVSNDDNDDYDHKPLFNELIDPTGINQSDIPVAIVSIDNQTLVFDCVDGRKCLPKINLGGNILIEPPYELGLVFYSNPASLFLILYSASTVPLERNLIHVNPQTGEIRSMKLPENLSNLHFICIGDQFIFADDDSKTIHIYQNDLTSRKLEVASSISRLIGIKADMIIALNDHPIEMDGVATVEFSIVNTISGEITNEKYKLPYLEINQSHSSPSEEKSYLINIEGISRDLKTIYCWYYIGSEPLNPRLCAFNLQNSNEVASTGEPDLVRLTSGYAQYHEMLYTSNSGDGYGVGAALIDMSDVTTLLDFAENPKWKRMLKIVPFGDRLLLGSVDAIVLLSLLGEITQEFPLPEKWKNQDYQLMYFME